MKISVLNGSPKGDTSVTMQYIHYIQENIPQHEFNIINISQRINAIEKKDDTFNQIIDKIHSSDGVLWAFPLYYLLVPSNYKRFIELIWERDVTDIFTNKYTAALSTSIHFFDHTAHNYINAICDDLGMNYVGHFSPDMYDLLKREERARLLLFANNFINTIENQWPTSKNFLPISYEMFNYVYDHPSKKIPANNKKILLISDSTSPQTNLDKMIQRFSMSYSNDIETINLYDVDIKGGCLGCIQCGYDNQCTYGEKDEYISFFNNKVKAADILIFAGSIKDRYLSSRWKLFFDRSFFNGHTPALADKQVGFIISGPLSKVPNLRQILEAIVELHQGNLVDFVTDENENSSATDALLQNLADKSIRFAREGYIKPMTFLGFGGRKIFRDDVFSRLRFPFRADHIFYKEKGLYDFPQKNYKTRITNFILLQLIKIPAMRKEIYTNRIKTEMIKPLQKLLKK